MTITDERRSGRRPTPESRASGSDSDQETSKGVLGQVVQTRGGVLVSMAGQAARRSFDPVLEEAKEKAAHVAYAGLAIAGTGMLGQGLAESHTPWGPLALAAPVAGWAAWRYSEGVVNRNLPYAEIEHTGRVRRFIAAVTTATGGWLASATAVGVDPHTLGGKINLTIGGLIGLWAASPYVRFRGQPSMPPPLPPSPSDDDLPPMDGPMEEPSLGWAVEVEKYVALWKQNVAVRDGALPNTSILPETMQEIQGGWTGTVSQDVPGSFGPERWVPSTGRIAAAFEIGLADITVEAASDNASKAQITVLHDNPLINFQNWAGPYAILGEEQVKTFDPDTGIAIIGIHSDGELVRYRFWNSGGAWHDLISGATGSGKSEFVNLLLGYERHACVEVPELDDDGKPKIDADGNIVKVKKGLIVSRIGDPQWGQSFGDWQDYVDWFAPTIDEIRIMLQKTEREMYARNKKFGRGKRYNKRLKKWQRGTKNFKATPELPLIVVTIDEAHEVLKDPECKRVVAALGKMGRKVGIKLRLITQVPLLQELGNDMAIRDAVASGNVIVFRTANSLSGQVAFNGALPASPNTIPREWPKGRAKPGQETTAGLGYALGASARSAIMRAFYPGEAIDWIYVTDPETGEAIGEWGVPGVLDPLTRAAGHGYEDRHKRLADLDDMDDVPESSIEHARRSSGMTCAQLVLSVFLSKAADDYKIKLGDLVKVVEPEFTPRMVSIVLGKFRDDGWTVSGKAAGLDYGVHQLTPKGREEAPEELSQDNVVENPAADEQRELARR